MQNLPLETAVSALEMSPLGVLILDKNNTVQWTNPAMCEFLSVPSTEIINQRYPDLCDKFLDGFSDHPDLWKVSNPVSVSSRWLLAISNPKNSSKEMKILYFSDASELIKLQTENRSLKDQLDNVSAADTLTGLLSKRSLMQALEPQVSRSRRYNNPLSVIIMNIDGFKAESKKIAPVTDQVLTSISFYLRDQMRWVDLVGRTGDNEFTLILPETGLDDAKKLASKISSRLDSMSLAESPDVAVKVNASFGIAEWEKGDDTTMLIRKVKQSLEQDSSNAATG